MPQIISTEPLAQMLRSIAFQKRTGMLHVEQLGERNAERGEIYFENGRPMRAQSGSKTGKAALQRISEWKQITCAFQGMSRPFPATTRVLAPAREAEGGNVLARRLLAEDHQTDTLSREVESADTEQLNGVRSQSVYTEKQRVQSPATRETETMVVAKRHIAASPARTNQPLILHGERLEEYTPEPPARTSRHIERWTTHLVPPAPAAPPRPPATPRLGPLPGEEALPGRMAIFKARSMVTTAQAIQSMERRERIIFILLDGRRTIQDIARLTHQPEFDVEQTLMHLTRRGYTQYVRG